MARQLESLASRLTVRGCARRQCTFLRRFSERQYPLYEKGVLLGIWAEVAEAAPAGGGGGSGGGDGGAAAVSKGRKKKKDTGEEEVRPPPKAAHTRKEGASKRRREPTPEPEPVAPPAPPAPQPAPAPAPARAPAAARKVTEEPPTARDKERKRGKESPPRPQPPQPQPQTDDADAPPAKRTRRAAKEAKDAEAQAPAPAAAPRQKERNNNTEIVVSDATITSTTSATTCHTAPPATQGQQREIVSGSDVPLERSRIASCGFEERQADDLFEVCSSPRQTTHVRMALARFTRQTQKQPPAAGSGKGKVSEVVCFDTGCSRASLLYVGAEASLRRTVPLAGAAGARNHFHVLCVLNGTAMLEHSGGPAAKVSPLSVMRFAAGEHWTLRTAKEPVRLRIVELRL